MLKFFLVILSVSWCVGQYVSNDDRENDDRNKPCLEISLECPKVDGEYPVYSALPNCSQFCQCSNGRPYLHDCPSVLHFNPVLNVCDYPENAGCISNDGGQTTEPNNEAESNPCIELGIACPEICGERPIYVNLTECSQYCECYNGNLLFRECPAGLHFNVNLEVCDFPERAGCDGENDGSGGGSDENNGDGDDDCDDQDNNTTNKEVDVTTRIPDTTSEEDSNPCFESGIKCPEVDGKYSVYGPLRNCSQFCQCSNGYPYLHDCPSDLHFNPVLNVCDYPDRAGCKDNGGGSGENEGSDECGDNGGDNNDSSEDNNTTDTEVVVTTRIPDNGDGGGDGDGDNNNSNENGDNSNEENNVCLESGIECPKIDGEYPVYAPLRNCSQFCQCSNGKPYLHNCPADLHFNPVLNVCDWPKNAGCKGHGPGESDEDTGDNGDNGDNEDNNNSDENNDNGNGDGDGDEDNNKSNENGDNSNEENNVCLESGIECPKVDGEYPVYAPLRNCSQFCQCSNGKPYLHNCPADLHFNPVLNVCDWPKNAGCKGHGPGGSDEDTGDNGDKDQSNENDDNDNGDNGDNEDNNNSDENNDNGNGDGDNNNSNENGDNSNEENNVCLESGIECPKVDGEYPVYAPLRNCSQFCQCSNGKPYLHNCPADLHFNPVLNVCDWPKNAGCKGHGPGGSDEDTGDNGDKDNSNENDDNDNGDNGDNEDNNNSDENNDNGNGDGDNNNSNENGDNSNEENNVCLESGIECPKVDGEYPVYAPLRNCSQFCQCSNGKPYLHNCPADLHFNPVLNVCDWPKNAGCKGHGPGGSDEDTGDNGDKDNSNENDDNDNGDNGDNEDNNNSDENNDNDNGGGDGDGDNNNSNENGDDENEENNVCLESGIECPKIDGEYPVYAPLRNCSQFCQCSNGKPYLHNCPADLHFNPVLNVCDWPKNAGCKGHGPGGSDEDTGDNGDKDNSNENDDNDNGDNGDNEDNNNSDENNDNDNGGGDGDGDNNNSNENDDDGIEENNVCLESGIECPKIDGEYPVYAPLRNCSQFCQCSNGKPYLHNCPADLHFNPVLNVCDWPKNAGCKGHGPGGSDEDTGDNGDKDNSNENDDNDNGDNGDNEDNNNSDENNDNDNGGGDGDGDNNNSNENDDDGNEENNVCLESGIECPKIDGEYPVYAPLRNCSQFCQCSNGKPYLHNCPADLHFNPVLNVCDWPKNAGCKGHGPGGSDEDTGDNGDKDNSNENDDNDNGDNGDNEDNNNSDENNDNDNGGGDGDGDNNNSNENGDDGNEENNVCLESGIECPKIDGEYPVYAPLRNCSQFCQCSNGKPYLHNCPADLHFNPVLNVCDWPKNAGCKGHGPGGSDEDTGDNGDKDQSNENDDNDNGDNGDNEDNNNSDENNDNGNGDGDNNNSNENGDNSNEENNVCLESGIECPKIDGEYPVYAPLRNCSQFCQCSNGKPYLHNCPADLHFNPVLNVCDWPKNAGCKGHGPGGSDEAEDGNGDQDDNNGDDEDSNTSSESGIGSGPCSESGIECPKVDGAYPVYAPLPNCSQFCQCSNGDAYLFDCPGDLHFNPTLNVCDYDYRAGCAGAGNDGGSDGASNICSQSKIDCPEVDGAHPVYAPLPDCSRFCQCSNGKPYVHSCPEGLHFNPTLEICDYAGYAGCVNHNISNLAQ